MSEPPESSRKRPPSDARTSSEPRRSAPLRARGRLGGYRTPCHPSPASRATPSTPLATTTYHCGSPHHQTRPASRFYYQTEVGRRSPPTAPTAQKISVAGAGGDDLASREDHSASRASSSHPFPAPRRPGSLIKPISPQIGLDSRRLLSYTMRDLDFRWLLDALTEGDFEHFPRYLPAHLLETGLDILAHIASRFVSPKPFLERSVELLYSHFLQSGGNYSEDVILRNFEVKVVSCSSSSCEEKNTHCPFAHFHGCGAAKLICVRWTEALSLVASRRAVLDSGLAYVRPADASRLMADRFAAKVRAWGKYDFHNIILPYCEQHFYTLPKDTPFHVAKEARKLNDENLTRYLSSMTAVRKDAVENAKLRPVYAQLSQRLAPSAPKSRGSWSSNFGDDFMTYAPPCVTNTVRRHAAQKTHHKFEERFELFNFCYNAGVSLEAVQRVWDELIDNDLHTTENKYTLKSLAKSHYDTCRSKKYKGTGCAKMTGCPFIEGGVRNTSACKAFCGAPDIEDMFWSPLKAASYLVKRVDASVRQLSSE